MEITFAGQTLMFLKSCLLGGAIGLFYEFFRLLRLCFPKNKFFIFVQDLLFFSVTAVVIFAFLLSENCGEIRGFIVFGIILGALIYYCTLGAVIVKINAVIVKYIKKILNFIFKIFFRPVFQLFLWIFTTTRRFFKWIFTKLVKIIKKSKKTVEKQSASSV